MSGRGPKKGKRTLSAKNPASPSATRAAAVRAARAATSPNATGTPELARAALRAAEFQRRSGNPIDVAGPAIPIGGRGMVNPTYTYGPTPNNLMQAMKETVHGGFVGLPPASPFDAALWGFTSRITAVKAAGEASHLRGNVGEVKSLARHVKMLSMNPSVYGNAYGVLGNS